MKKIQKGIVKKYKMEKILTRASNISILRLTSNLKISKKIKNRLLLN